MNHLFSNRTEAGQLLALHLAAYTGLEDWVVLALPRGGVPVAYPVAKKLKLPLELFLVRKLGVPGQEELAMGAIASNGVVVFNQAVLQQLELSQNEINAVIEKEKETLQTYQASYIGERKLINLYNKNIILIDDGIATGATIRVAISALRQSSCGKLVVGVPLGPPDVVQSLRPKVDEFICLQTPEPFFAIGNWYENFDQTEDSEVIDLLKKSTGS